MLKSNATRKKQSRASESALWDVVAHLPLVHSILRQVRRLDCQEKVEGCPVPLVVAGRAKDQDMLRVLLVTVFPALAMDLEQVMDLETAEGCPVQCPVQVVAVALVEVVLRAVKGPESRIWVLFLSLRFAQSACS